jgi:hypothetical protein
LFKYGGMTIYWLKQMDRWGHLLDRFAAIGDPKQVRECLAYLDDALKEALR